MQGIEIMALGGFSPSKIMTNADFEKIVDTSDEWITTRTGIKQRHFSEDKKNWPMAYSAVSDAIERSGIDKSQVGAIIVATFTGDYLTPSVACILQKELGLPTDIPAFDLNAACSGFLYALRVCNSLLTDSDKPYGIVLGSEVLSKHINMEDRGTCVLFGDGCGAAVIKQSEDKEFHGVWGAEGMPDLLGCRGTAMEDQYLFMDGPQVFKLAVKTMSNIAVEVLEKAQLTIDDIDYVICHQANERIIRSVGKKLKVPEEKLFMNIQTQGNTSSASIPLAMNEMREKGCFKDGAKALLVGFGAGMTWGSMVVDFLPQE